MRALQLFAILGLACVTIARAGGDDYTYDREVQTLLKTTHFGFGGVGMTRNIPAGEAALRRIMQRDDAIKYLFPVFDNGTPAGKCYALVGFRLLSPKYFESSCKRIAPWNDSTIDAVSGCIVGERKLAEIVHLIRDGRYDDETLGKKNG
jgi:hypothetical protein